MKTEQGDLFAAPRQTTIPEEAVAAAVRAWLQPDEIVSTIEERFLHVLEVALPLIPNHPEKETSQ